ncbi:hypothetical protein KSP40_PGU006788 [Platanthera guangdongensis]|uniref:Uncharacterized protein n=1 Tax=Platanthera guangdongensis TaxID=2320717 RepID=A0ABR2LH11_9ASPA
MACGVAFVFRPAMVRPNAGGSRGDLGRRGGGAWWSPLFGWGAEADYIESGGIASPEKAVAMDREFYPAEERQRRYGMLTEEKARELRMRMTETESFHDAMYHSAIASRLASDVRRRSGCRN